MEKNAIFNEYQKLCARKSRDDLRNKMKQEIAENPENETKIYVISCVLKGLTPFWDHSPDPAEIASNRIVADVLKAVAKANDEWFLDRYTYYRKREKEQPDDDPHLERVDVFCFPKETTTNESKEKEPTLVSILDTELKRDDTIYHKFFSCASIDGGIEPKKTVASKKQK